ncbi:NAD(P)-dependent alcohol dehydrogenase [Streptomyces sp. NPDC046977]|uniref:NAD(P)-dependent alcohol dehydrogenase n=1 Tax=Streptomyces sp. NPDC046977 TaxID=3154703 RepID=UPI0033EEC9E4
MKAVVQDRYGSTDVLQVEEIPTPTPTGAQVLVRVHAASVNARDWHLMRGDPYLARPSIGFGSPKVKVRGTDFAGRVEAVGPDVRRLRPGDEVFGEADGAFAEYVCAPEDVVAAKPANLSFEEAACLPLAANTALVGLRDLGKVRPGQKVLVNGASGGVGPFAVQMAAGYGAQVTGVCSTRNADLVRSCGAGHVVDYTREDFTRDGRRHDLVLDLVGNRSLTALLRVLHPAGTLVLSGGGVSKGGSLVGPMGLLMRGQIVARLGRRRVRVLVAQPGPENLATLRELAESGVISPVIDRSYPLAEAPEAIRYLEVEHARAKVVVTV